jgi:formamidopyrimidine-DNA glycosylase
MPELPEVETVRRHLEPGLTGAVIEHAEIHDSRLTRPHDPAVVASALTGGHVASVDRRGKYLIVRFLDGRVLLVHLRMTGSFRHAPHGTLPADPHRRAVLSMDNGSDVGYRDVRRFGTWELFESGEAEEYLALRLGPEPLDSFRASDLAARLAPRRAALKTVLLDQRVVAGLGNIYADEALWWARLHPLRGAGGLDADEVRNLHRAIRRVLRQGIERQGATLRDYTGPSGEEGAMQDEFRAYGRAGEPCDRCHTPLERIVVGGRGTTFCPVCQPEGGVDHAPAGTARTTS